MPTPYEHIACCLDPSPGSDRALEEAVRLREFGPGRLSLVHATRFPWASGFAGAEPDPQDLLDADREWLGERAASAPGSEVVLLEGVAAPDGLRLGRGGGRQPDRGRCAPRHAPAHRAGQLRRLPHPPRALRRAARAPDRHGARAPLTFRGPVTAATAAVSEPRGFGYTFTTLFAVMRRPEV